MAGVTYHIEINDHGTASSLRSLLHAASDRQPIMKIAGAIAQKSVVYNFELGGRPKWKALAVSTLKYKAKYGINLGVLKGRTGNLAMISYKATATEAVIGTSPSSKDYAAIQNFGGQAGRGHKVTIPARPFMVLQQEDLDDMQAAIANYLESALAKKV